MDVLYSSLRLQLWAHLCLAPRSAITTGTISSSVKLPAALKLECTWQKLILGKILIFILLPTWLKQVTWSGAVFLHSWTFFIFWTCPVSTVLRHYCHRYIGQSMCLSFVFRTEGQKERKIPSVFCVSHHSILGDIKYAGTNCMCGETKLKKLSGIWRKITC